MIEVKNVSAGYGKAPVLRDISVSFEKGRLTSVIGPNGSGKSTLLKTVIGILTPDSGEIFADGDPLAGKKQRDIAKRISYLAQGKGTPDMTVEQMVLHGRFPHLGYPRRYTKLDREIAFSAMAQVGIEGLASRSMASLSGGMRQNAYIAMALCQDTDYILLDEPTTYLDIAHQLELMRILRSLADRGKGIAAVMHDLPLAFTFSDNIAVIKDGEAVMCSSPESVCTSGAVKDVLGVTLSHTPGGYSYDYMV